MIIKILQTIILSFIVEKILLQSYYTCNFSYYFFLMLYVGIFILTSFLNIFNRLHRFNCCITIIGIVVAVLTIFLSMISFFIFLFQLYNGSLCFNYSDKIMIWVLILGVLFLFIFLFLICFCKNHRRRNPIRRPNRRLNRRGIYSTSPMFEIELSNIYKSKKLEKKKIENFVAKYKNDFKKLRPINKKEKELIKIFCLETEFDKDQSCIICFGVFEKGMDIINLDKKFKNLFHFDCLISWFVKQFCCPISKKSGILILLDILKNIK